MKTLAISFLIAVLGGNLLYSLYPEIIPKTSQSFLASFSSALSHFAGLLFIVVATRQRICFITQFVLIWLLIWACVQSIQSGLQVYIFSWYLIAIFSLIATIFFYLITFKTIK